MSEAVKPILVEQIISFYNSDTASLLIGVLLGDTSSMSPSFKHNLSVTGMQHVVSASGFNVGLVLWGVYLLIRPIPVTRFAKLTFSFLCVMWYVFLAGASWPLIRAALMSSFSLGSQVMLRTSKAGWSLMCTVFLLVLFDPTALESISFQLSVSATAGLIWVLPIIQRVQLTQYASWELADFPQESGFGSQGFKSFKRIILTQMTESFTVSLAAQSLSLPLIMYHFGELSLLSLPTNTVLLWLTPIITINAAAWTGLSIFQYYLAFPAGNIVLSLLSYFVQIPAALFIFGLETLGSFEATLIELGDSFSVWSLLGWWLVVFLVVVFRSRLLSQTKNKTL